MKRKILLSALGLAILVFFYFARAAFAPLFLGAFFAYIILPAVKALENKGVGRYAALLLVYLIVAFIIFSTFSIGIPHLVVAVESLQKTIIEFLGSFKLPVAIPTNLDDLFLQFHDAIFGYVGKAVITLVSTVSMAINIILGLVLSFYIILDREKIKDTMLSIIPRDWREFAINIAIKSDNVIKQFVRGQLGVALVMSSMLFVGLKFLNIKHALLLAVLAGLLEVVPYFGALLGAAPAVIAAAAHSPQKAIWTAVLFTVVQQIEGAYVSPKILGECIRIHPIIVIMSVIIGGHMFGFAGMIFAVPACGIIKCIGIEIIETLEKKENFN
jgi:predicted PurR-regulated permease PerM